MAPQGPFKLITVNNAPERAQRLIGRVVQDMKDRYEIYYVANAESEVTVLGDSVRADSGQVLKSRGHFLSSTCRMSWYASTTTFSAHETPC